MEQFASGWKRSYYGKGDVIVYRLNRDGLAPAGQSPVFGASVLMLLYGDAFWPTYTTGDNTGLIATDSMKNFIQRETMNFPGSDLEGFCHFLADEVPRHVSTGRRHPGLRRGDSVRRARRRRRSHRRGRHGPRRGRAAARACRRGMLRHPRFQAPSSRRQRVPRLRSRRVHHAAGSDEPAAAHVARPRLAATRSLPRRSTTARWSRACAIWCTRCSSRSSPAAFSS